MATRRKPIKPNWAKNLTRKELKHLAEGSATGRPTLISLKRNLAAQRETGIVCFECNSIALKLGVSVESEQKKEDQNAGQAKQAGA